MTDIEKFVKAADYIEKPVFTCAYGRRCWEVLESIALDKNGLTYYFRGGRRINETFCSLYPEEHKGYDPHA